MPNKTMTLQVDLMPVTDSDYNLGNASTKWTVNGCVVTPISNETIDSLLEAMDNQEEE